MLKTSKKVVSIILAVVLAFSVMSVAAFAAFDSSTQKLGLVLVPDKDLTKLAPGDEVTFTMYCDVADFNTLFGTYKIPVFFDPAVYTADNAYTLYNDFAKFYKPASTTTVVTAAAAVSKLAGYASNLDTARHTAFVNFLGAADTGLGVTAAGGYKMTPAEAGGTRTGAELSFKMTVKADADLVNGNTDVVIPDAFSYTSGMYFKTTNGTKTTNLTNAQVNTEAANAMANNPAPAGPVVAKAKSQVKMTATSATTVADEFSFRVISKISNSDWDTYFKNTGVAGATTDYITAVGMVAYKGTAAFDAETAKKVVAGTPANDYSAAKTDYISKANDTADAQFGAIIKAKHSTLTNDVTYMGFVQYVDASGNAQTIFYETAGTAALSTNYDTIVNAYLAAYPFAA
jgi:hypothetical protein